MSHNLQGWHLRSLCLLGLELGMMREEWKGH